MATALRPPACCAYCSPWFVRFAYASKWNMGLTNSRARASQQCHIGSFCPLISLFPVNACTQRHGVRCCRGITALSDEVLITDNLIELQMQSKGKWVLRTSCRLWVHKLKLLGLWERPAKSCPKSNYLSTYWICRWSDLLTSVFDCNWDTMLISKLEAGLYVTRALYWDLESERWETSQIKS